MGDWDGDGSRTPGVVRGNVWHLRNSNSAGFADVVFKYGVATDIPIVGDWDADGTDTPGVVRTHPEGCGNQCFLLPTWYLRNSNTAGYADMTFSFGGDFVGDWDGDNDDTPAGRNSIHWFLNNGYDSSFDFTFDYGLSSDRPIVGDWDGNGPDGVGVIRGNVWLIRNALTSGFAEASFLYGRANDVFLTWR